MKFYIRRNNLLIRCFPHLSSSPAFSSIAQACGSFHSNLLVKSLPWKFVNPKLNLFLLKKIQVQINPGILELIIFLVKGSVILMNQK